MAELPNSSSGDLNATEATPWKEGDVDYGVCLPDGEEAVDELTSEEAPPAKSLEETKSDEEAPTDSFAPKPAPSPYSLGNFYHPFINKLWNNDVFGLRAAGGAMASAFLPPTTVHDFGLKLDWSLNHPAQALSLGAETLGIVDAGEGDRLVAQVEAGADSFLAGTMQFMGMETLPSLGDAYAQMTSHLDVPNFGLDPSLDLGFGTGSSYYLDVAKYWSVKPVAEDISVAEVTPQTVKKNSTETLPMLLVPVSAPTPLVYQPVSNVGGSGFSDVSRVPEYFSTSAAKQGFLITDKTKQLPESIPQILMVPPVVIAGTPQPSAQVASVKSETAASLQQPVVAVSVEQSHPQAEKIIAKESTTHATTTLDAALLPQQIGLSTTMMESASRDLEVHFATGFVSSLNTPSESVRMTESEQNRSAQKSVGALDPDGGLHVIANVGLHLNTTENPHDKADARRQKDNHEHDAVLLALQRMSILEASLAQNALAQAGTHARVEDNTRFINAAAWMGGRKSLDVRSEREAITDQADVVREMDNHLARASRSSHTESDTNGSQHKPDWSQLLTEAPSGEINTSQPQSRDVSADESDVTLTPILITDSVVV